VSCAGLTTGHGGEGARITSRISFGGWLYPEGLCAGTACVEAAFSKDEFVCARTSADIEEATSAPTKRRLKAFWTRMSTLRLNFPAKTDRQDVFGWL